MATLRDDISRVRSTHHLLSFDTEISDRAIAAELKSSAHLLMKRETDKRKLWSTDSAFEEIGCLRLQTVSLAECCDAPPGAEIARSVHKLPPVLEGAWGHLVQGVYNVNGTKQFKEVTLSRYINLQKLPRRRSGEIYYFFLNGYLYITQPEIQAIRIRAHFEEDLPESLLYPKDCEVCGGSAKTPPCSNPLDRPFRRPGYLSDQIVSLTSEKLLQRYFNVSKDHSTDGRDEQVRKS